MNAATHPETSAIAYTLHERAMEMAEEELCTAERFGGWIESASYIRESSATFGPISNGELMALALKLNNNEKVFSCLFTLRRRFLAEHCAEIAERATELSRGVA